MTGPVRGTAEQVDAARERAAEVARLAQTALAVPGEQVDLFAHDDTTEG